MTMSDIEKTKLMKALSRIRGQGEALRRVILEQGAPGAKLLQQAPARRGAVDGFIAEERIGIVHPCLT